jgi:C4-dicarboxylate-specific signal transduction histidine kinase
MSVDEVPAVADIEARLQALDKTNALIRERDGNITLALQLFRPFVTTKPHGMGVGLSISRTIIESHGGRIWDAPNPGDGAIFRFTLHLVREPDLADA